MNKKPFIALAAGLIALLSACSDNVVEAGPDSNISKGSISVLVQDANEGNKLDMQVTLLTTGKKTTAKNGQVVFKDLPAGSHQVLVEDPKNLYASMTFPITLEHAPTGESQREAFYIVDNKTLNAQLYPRTSGLTGYVYYKDKSNKSAIVSGATVRVTLTNTTFTSDRITEVTTDAKGFFEFKDLPAVGTAYVLSFNNQEINGITYIAPANINGSTATSLTSQRVTHVTNRIEYANIATPFIVVKRTEYVDPSGPVYFVYSDSIDAKEFREEQVTFYNVSRGEVQQIPVTITVKGDSLKITPFGEWPANFYVRINNLKSVNGATNATLNNNVTTTVTPPEGNLITVTRGDFNIVRFNDATTPFFLSPIVVPTVDPTGVLAITFNDKIDASKFNKERVTVYACSGTDASGTTCSGTTNTIPVNAVVKDSTLEVAPISGEWVSGTTPTSANYLVIYISNSIISVKNKSNAELSSNRLIKVNNGDFYLLRIKGEDNSGTYLGKTETLALVFSDTIDASKFRTSMVTIGSSAVNTPVTITVKDDSLLVKPIGEWPGDFTVAVNGSLASARNKLNTNTAAKTIRVAVDDLSAEILTLEISSSSTAPAVIPGYNTQSVILAWNKIKDVTASNYQLYCKTSDKTSYTKLTGTNTIGATTVYATVNLSSCGVVSPYNLDTNKVEFFVMAVNDRTKTEPSNTLVIKDVAKPTISGGRNTNNLPVNLPYYRASATDSVLRFGYNSQSLTFIEGSSVFDYQRSSHIWFARNYWRGFDKSVDPISNGYTGQTQISYADWYTFDGEDGDCAYGGASDLYFDGTEYYSSSFAGGYGVNANQFDLFSDLSYNLSKAVKADSVIRGYFSFNEPMDTLATLAIAAVAAVAPEVAVPRLEFTTSWQDEGGNPSDNVLQVTVNVAAGTETTVAANQRFSISGLKDLNGNEFEVDYGTRVTPRKKGLEFRIATYGYDPAIDYRPADWVSDNCVEPTP